MNSDALSILHHHLLTALASAPAETRRLFHGRGRCWPGLEQVTVDWLQGVVLVALFKEPEPQQLEALKQLLLALSTSPQWQACGAHTLLLQHRYQLQSPVDWLVGEPIDEWTLVEEGLRYRVDLGQKQNNGLFLDMRYGRNWVRANARDKRVLNLFAYTCGFSVAAIEGGATHVVNLDMSRAALSRGRDNHRLNGHDLSRVSFLGHDLFKSWSKVKSGGPYDLVIIDPPSFQKGSFLLTKDYARVLRRLPELLTADGCVLACMNDPAVASDFLIDGVTREAPGLRFEQRLDNPPEFPDSDIESGLKALVFRRVE
ncbi:class I SAM-dependent methyltransferase [Pseudomonas chlororaphis]|uniref:class I SAM-dependent methyltransferase n=1 Tax=Pseudomonas chlororaphis TaxID=587753 RepID=UPI0006A58513|nr:class I SAM-dependent methyltransferase [Pseudomonas chlororaphis]AZD01625.1 putative methyltransferase [Pseudomonas chlororaphis subsp. chlororaphis]MBM0284729.1 class I SAM-dependent methyltransferase [Pseudomonas chlororaphis]MDO1508469.1 methyltransferase [Pseudomonas chlororaphis]ORM49574.1 methyltransferase [Pseudomonas chlororaphis subsp. chlororaphis]TWR98850.1 methyltransferase [Pseudomonas chlororaphis subsp. chlororaphis]